MADDRYSLKYTAFDERGLAFGDTSLTSGVSAQGAFARDQLASLDLALETLGLKLRTADHGDRVADREAVGATIVLPNDGRRRQG